jgi:hypothetical protein
MSPKNANPGAGGARVHGISKSDAASPSRNQLPAQSNPAARSAQANAVVAATIILHAALGLGIEVGASPDGELVMLVPLKVPRAVRVRFETHEFRAEVIAVIQANAAARGGV